MTKTLALLGSTGSIGQQTLQVARELGLLDKLMQVGWAGLSTAESGKIGGMVGARKQKKRKDM